MRFIGSRIQANTFEAAETIARRKAKENGCRVFIIHPTPTSNMLAVVTEKQWLASFPLAETIAAYDINGIRADSNCIH